MIKEGLFAAEEREAKLDRLGDVLQAMEQHVDFKRWPPRPTVWRRVQAGRGVDARRFRRN